MTKNLEKAYFAAGCFWCIQEVLDRQEGVIETTVGYMGGDKTFPTYEEVCTGKTGHAEAIEVMFNPNIISFEKLLNIFWENIDPSTPNGQFCDLGTQYRTAIFYCDDNQKAFAEESKKQLQKFKTIQTEIKKKTTFFPAEEYHQKYYLKKPISYNHYHDHSGRKKNH